MLRVYAAAYGLNSGHHALVEIGVDEIIVRVDTRWIRFTRDEMTSSDSAQFCFAIEVDGQVRIGDVTEEMDMAAEALARKIFSNR